MEHEQRVQEAERQAVPREHTGPHSARLAVSIADGLVATETSRGAGTGAGSGEGSAKAEIAGAP